MSQPNAKHYEQALKKRKKFQRFVEIERAKPIEEREDRTVEVIFSSDDDVEMWFGTERLLHGKDNVDLSFFNSQRSPLLIDHRRDSESQIGIIENAEVRGGKGYATIRFGRGPKAEEYYRDTIDGIRTCLSVGYEVHEWNIREDENYYEATSWTPRETSFVTFPADDTVGVIRSGRSDYLFELETEEEEEVLTRSVLDGDAQAPEETRTSETEDESQESGTQESSQSNDSDEKGSQTATDDDGGESPESERGNVPPDADGKVKLTPRSEVGEGGYGAEAHQIFEFARQLKVDMQRAYKAVEQKQSFADFAMEITQELSNARMNANGEVEIDDDATYEGATVEKKDAERFSISALIAGKLPDVSDTVGGLERDICEEEESKRREAGIKTEGFAIPGSVVSQSAIYHQNRARERNMHHRTTLTAGTDATAGHLIDSELRPENLIEWLYGEFAVSRAATWLMNAKGNIAIPKQDGRTVATWGTETAAATESNPTYTLLELSPKELRVLTPFTKTFAIQSSVDAENEVRRTLMRGLGEALDTGLLYGSGSNSIQGVNTIDRIDSSPHAGRIEYTKAGLTYAECLSGLENLGNQNTIGPGVEWITSWKFWAQAKGTAMLTNGSMPIWYHNMIGDFPATVTSQVRQGTQHAVGTTTDRPNADHAFVANWMYLLVAMWGGMDIVVDPYTLSDQGMIRVVGFYRVDCDFAHDDAFVFFQRAA